MPILFPTGLWPVSHSLSLLNTSRSGGASLTGSEQVTVSGAGSWRMTAQFAFPASRSNAIREWEAFIAALNGRAGTFLCPAFTYIRPRDPNGKIVSPVSGDCPDSSVSFHDGGTMGIGRFVYATLAANVAVGATRITIPAATPSWQVPRPGMVFGIGNRTYRATLVYRDASADPWTIDFVPPVRVAASSGATVITDRPVIEMRLASDESGVPDYSRISATASLQAVEAF